MTDIALVPFQLRQHLSPRHVHLLLTPDARQAEYIYRNAKYWLGDEQPIYWLSDWETLPYDRYTPHPDLIAERLRVLAELPTRKNGVVISSASALRQWLVPQSYFDRHGLHLTVGDKLGLDDFVHRLITAGYQKTVHIAHKGEFAQRGAIVDLFPIGASDPIRLEWFDDHITTLRTFALETQLTLSQQRHISILPRSEVDLSDAGRVCFRQKSRALFGDKITASTLYEQISTGKSPQGLEYYLPLFFDDMATLFDYLPAHTRFIGDPADLAPALAQHAEYCARRFERCNPLREQLLLPPEKLWLAPAEVLAALARLPQHPYPSRATRIPFTGSSSERAAQWEEILATHDNVVIHCPTQGSKEKWTSVTPHRVVVSPNGISFAADGVTHLSESDLHPIAAPINYRQRGQQNAAAMIRSLRDVHIGEPVVHVDFGVGRYAGLQLFDDEELFAIEYAKGAKVYVPMRDLDLISKYGSGDPDNAPLHELGKNVWRNSQRKAREAIRDTAAELLALYAQRAATTGIIIADNPTEQARLAATFPYEETPDQQQAIAAVRADLARAQPMDRIICGDVGFGKTEVAVRAVYAAVLAGYQVAIIAPTTLLAEQHHHHFVERLGDFALRIDSLSRFKSAGAAKKVLQQLAAGDIDVIIGTHRLLQKDVAFHNLGLVIIDEEQRFGVRQKEQLKALRSNVNLLTLTATPIPRTLNLALGGLRDLSLMSTPPAGRQNVQTILSEWDAQLIEEACEREHQRGGQTFFVHNDIDSIERIARLLQDLLPTQKIALAHGQMRERELEKIMQDFCSQHYDILLTTTIIESGIDIPSANTIIIHRADKLGLAQLHQLRGRVGRSHHQAYAYLITPALSTLPKDAQRRLEAFTTLDSLGAGFLLASQDLEIRGAGEILGAEQSGQIQQIGISYYLDLLEKTIQALKKGDIVSLDDTPPRAEVHFPVPTLLPNDYIFDPQQRLLIYQRLTQCKNAAERATLRAELIDRFGALPPPAQYLWAQMGLRQQAQQLGLTQITLRASESLLDFRPDAAIRPEVLFARIQSAPERYRMNNPTALTVRHDGADDVLAQAEEIAALLDEIALVAVG